MQPYRAVLDAMREFTAMRSAGAEDELWLVQHPAVFTLGQAGRREHLLAPGGLEVVPSDRGGQVTYHGPGQLVAYPLVDLRRARIGVRDFVHLLEESVIETLRPLGLHAARRSGAPGVYVDGAKIASLGLRVRRGCTYHGIALNVSVALEPFSRIDPCGFPGLAVTRLADHGVGWEVDEAGRRVARSMARLLGRRAAFRPADLERHDAGAGPALRPSPSGKPPS